MVKEVVTVKYHQHAVGALSLDTDTGIGAFEYEPGFIQKGIELSPLKMPLSTKIFSFPEIDYAAFKGLPGMIADSLPDDFGNAVLNAWVAAKGQSSDDITALQRLQYIGKRGMGALSYTPARQLKNLNASHPVDIRALVAIAQQVLNDRKQFSRNLHHQGKEDKEAMMALLSIGSSAGGARPKAVLAFNADFTQVRSGQTDVPDGFTHYLMKFDGVSEHKQNTQTFGDPLGYGSMEFVYYLIARKCGIDMMPCKLLDEGHRRHFITQRFDRQGNNKIHVQTLNGLAHISYKQAGSYSYAELIGIARKLKLSATDADQIFKRMVFNVVARNHDDHSKNIAFMLDNQHQWKLAPAYDLAYSYKPGSKWVDSHWMTINGKRDNFIREDFYTFTKLSPMFTRKYVDRIIEQTSEFVSEWPTIAADNDVPGLLIDTIKQNLKLLL